MTKYNLIDRTAFAPLFDRSVGLDRMLDRMFSDVSSQAPSFPPYNIRKVNEYDRLIEMAVAGYAEEDLDITVESGILTITGGKSEDVDDSLEYIHKGVAARKFTRQFQLADNAEVKGAKLENGMLGILIVLNEPEKNVQKIAINGDMDRSAKLKHDEEVKEEKSARSHFFK